MQVSITGQQYIKLGLLYTSKTRHNGLVSQTGFRLRQDEAF